MNGSSKLLASKVIRLQSILLPHYETPPKNLLTRCGYVIVERITMSKRKATEVLSSPTIKKSNNSNNFVFYEAVNKHNKKPTIKTVSPTKIGKRPIYKFFIDFDGIYFPLRCMLDLGSTSFVISPEAAKAFGIPVVKRVLPTRVSDVGGKKIDTEGLHTIPLGLSFGNHRPFVEKDHAFEVMKTSSQYDALIPAWYLQKHKAEGMTAGHLHFLFCSETCFSHQKLRPDYEITYDKRVALRADANNIGTIISPNPEIAKKLPEHYHKWLLLFDPEEAEKLPDNKGCDHRIQRNTAEDQLRMGPIYQLSIEEEKILIKYIEKIIKEGKIWQSSSPVGSPIFFVPKPSGKGLWLCVDYRHLDQHTVKDKTPLPIMDELKQ